MKNSSFHLIVVIIQNIFVLGFILLFVVIESGWLRVETISEAIIAIIMVLLLSAITGYFYSSYFRKKVGI